MLNIPYVFFYCVPLLVEFTNLKQILTLDEYEQLFYFLVEVKFTLYDLLSPTRCSKCL